MNEWDEMEMGMGREIGNTYWDAVQYILQSTSLYLAFDSFFLSFTSYIVPYMDRWLDIYSVVYTDQSHLTPRAMSSSHY